MLVVVIVSTILLALSFIFATGRHIVLYDDEKGFCIFAILWSLLWRGYIIFVLWWVLSYARL